MLKNYCLLWFIIVFCLADLDRLQVHCTTQIQNSGYFGPTHVRAQESVFHQTEVSPINSPLIPIPSNIVTSLHISFDVGLITAYSVPLPRIRPPAERPLARRHLGLHRRYD